MSETTAELIALYRERNELRHSVERLEESLAESVKHHAVATENNVNLGNENKRLEKERDGLRGEVENADASYTAMREAFEVQLVRAMNAEAQRNEAAQHLEWLLRAHAELVPPDYDKEWDRWMLASYQDLLKAARGFLAGLSTTEEQHPDRPSDEELAPGLADRKADRMVPLSEVKAELGIEDQPCQRVSVCGSDKPHLSHYDDDCAKLDTPHPPCDGVMRCSRHGCPWPEEGECPATVPPLLTKGLREDGQ